MKAAVLDGYGAADRFVVREVPEPREPGPGEVRIRVRAAGVNPLDLKLRRGSLRWLRPARFPLILGVDAAGEVEAVGPEVTRFEVGDPVFGGCDVLGHGGAYAELALAREAALAEKPEALGWEEAAALPVAGLTALQGLRDRGELRSGERLLVNGAAGGVGHLAVQLGFALGARVTGVASRKNLDFVRSLGAEEVIDYAEEGFAAQEGRWDVIFDVAGTERYGDCEAALVRDGGIFVTTLPGPRIAVRSFVSYFEGLVDGRARRARFVVVRFRGDDLETLLRYHAQGRLVPELADVIPLEQVARAHGRLEAGVRGKVVLRMD